MKNKKITVDGVEYVRADSIENQKPLATLTSLNDLIGRKVFIRTVTYHALGRVVGIVDGFIELEDSAWIADSGRFMDFLQTGVASEVEPVGRMWVATSNIVDFVEWNHNLLREQI